MDPDNRAVGDESEEGDSVAMWDAEETTDVVETAEIDRLKVRVLNILDELAGDE